MAGNTAAIDRATLEAQWATYRPMAEIAAFHSISKDQLIRLRTVWSLPLRLDRKRRYKPSRLERMLDPGPDEMMASESSLDLAPLVARRVTCVQVTWSDETRAARQATQPTPFRLARLDVPEELRDKADDMSW